jgi:hypothetical protein
VTTFFPAGVGTIGKDLWLWATTIASPAAATTTELTAVSTVQIQNAMRPGFGINSDVSKVDDRRLGAFITYQSFGTTTKSFPDATFIDRPQDTTGVAARKHIETIVEGLAGYLINRRGLGSAPENFVAWATTQKYRLYPVIAGPQTFIAIADDGGQFEYTQGFTITGAEVAGIVV